MKVNKILFLLEYLIAGALVLDCRSIWTASPMFSDKVAYLDVIIILLSGIGICCINQMNISGIHLEILILFAIYLFIYGSINPTKRINYFAYMTIFVLFLYMALSDRAEIKKILIAYSNLIFINAIVSLIFWILGTRLNVIHPTNSIASVWSDSGLALYKPSYYNLYFETQADNLSFLRNSAIYTESPMAGLNFSLAFLIKLFLQKKVTISKIIILVLAIFSTHSTTAYLVVILTILFKLFFYKNKTIRNLLRSITVILIPISLFIIFIMLKSKFSSFSGGIRTDDYKVGFQIWKDYPIFGCGFNNDSVIQSYMGSWRIVNNGFSNSIMYVLATGGIYLEIIYIVMFLKGLLISIKNKKIDNVFLYAVFFLIWGVMIVPYNYVIVLMFVLMGTTSTRKE